VEPDLVRRNPGRAHPQVRPGFAALTRATRDDIYVKKDIYEGHVVADDQLIAHRRS